MRSSETSSSLFCATIPLMIIAMLIVLGLCLGSFVNALVWRLHQQELPKKRRKANTGDLSIIRGRSMCPECGHTLGLMDLIPLLSWLGLGGKCRYCKKPIPWQYPAVEIVAATLFTVSYLFWPEDFDARGLLYFALWIVCLTGFMALVVYDLRWMILPNRIVFPLLAAAAAATIVDAAFISQSLEPAISAVMGLLVGGGIFYVLFELSKGRWIGGGDVKLGFLLGILVAGPLEALMVLFFASLLGTLILAPKMFRGKVNAKTRIPFGPMLIAAAVIVRLFGERLSDWYLNTVIF